MDLTDTYGTFHPKAAEYIIFSRANGTFSRIDHMQGHKTSLNKIRRFKLYQEFFSDNTMRLENNYKKKTTKNTNVVVKICYHKNTINMLLSDQRVTEELKRKFKKYLEISENGNTQSKIYGTQKKQF